MIKENLPIYIKRFILGLIIVIAALLQNTPGVMPQMFSANAMLLIPVCVSIAMFENEIVSLVFGLVAGLLWDFTAPEGYFFHSIVLCIAAFFVSMLVRRRVRNTLFGSMVLTFATVFLHNTVYWILFVLIPQSQGAGGVYFRFYFPSCIYTVLVGIVIYLIIRPVEKTFRV
ncbi:MAG: rod shape-determining protein MreD [Clostridia bacterium]|nr:rod shape-determining protein MreD [Clostridia bacterium]